MCKSVWFFGIDVHKNSISIGIADQSRDGEVGYYGRINSDMNQVQDSRNIRALPTVLIIKPRSKMVGALLSVYAFLLLRKQC